MKKISVIVPCYNVAPYIDRCVHSLLSQTIGAECLELIFVDDASTDSTVQKLSQWEARYPESIMVVVCEKNGRQGRARNIGLQYAAAPYICYVDADDWVDSEMLQAMYEKALQYDVEVVTCRSGRDYGDGILFSVDDICRNKEEMISIQSIGDRKKLLEMRLGHLVGKLYKKSFLFDYNLVFPEGLAYEDNYISGLISYSLNSLYVLENVYYHYFVNMSSTVTATDSSHHLDRLEIEIKLYDELCRRGYFEEFSQEIKGRFLRMYYLNSLHLVFMRFNRLPYDVLETMRREVLQRVPDYKESETYQQLPEIGKGFCLTLETEMTKEMWDNLANNYRYLNIER